MKEGPILMNAPMVRATLDGSKTQTRRVVKPQLLEEMLRDHAKYGGRTLSEFMGYRQGWQYGQPGEHLWVRETCRAEELDSGLDGVRYMADDAFRPIENSREASDAWLKLRHYGKKPAVPGSNDWRKIPSIHMPRWASRILLEIVSVRIERLHDISEEDAKAEGIRATGDGAYHVEDDLCRAPNAKECFARLWESIYGTDSWESNPWAWVREFKAVKP